VEIDKLSPNGRKLIQDAHDIIETARMMMQDKNTDELPQSPQPQQTVPYRGIFP
jgi:hypothetical protein